MPAGVGRRPLMAAPRVKVGPTTWKIDRNRRRLGSEVEVRRLRSAEDVDDEPMAGRRDRA